MNQQAPSSSLTPTQALSRGFAQDQALQAHSDGRASPVAVGEQFRQGFRIGDVCLMIRYENGSELTEMPEVSSLAQRARLVLRHRQPARDAPAGVRPLPLCRHRAPSGCQADAAGALHGADAAGMVIDGLPQRLRWSIGQGNDPGSAPAQLAPHVRSAALIGEQLWFDLDCAALLDAMEQDLTSLP